VVCGGDGDGGRSPDDGLDEDGCGGSLELELHWKHIQQISHVIKRHKNMGKNTHKKIIISTDSSFSLE